MLNFSVLVALYLPISVTGYALMGQDVPANILFYRGNSYEDLTIPLVVATVFEIINLYFSVLILINPVYQGLEEILGTPKGEYPQEYSDRNY